MKYSKGEINQKARNFINKNVLDTNEAIKGAQDIIAQRYADDFKSKEIIRKLISNWGGEIHIKEAKEFDKDGVYSNFVNSIEKK